MVKTAQQVSGESGNKRRRLADSVGSSAIYGILSPEDLTKWLQYDDYSPVGGDYFFDNLELLPIKNPRALPQENEANTVNAALKWYLDHAPDEKLDEKQVNTLKQKTPQRFLKAVSEIVECNSDICPKKEHLDKLHTLEKTRRTPAKAAFSPASVGCFKNFFGIKINSSKCVATTLKQSDGRKTTKQKGFFCDMITRKLKPVTHCLA